MLKNVMLPLMHLAFSVEFKNLQILRSIVWSNWPNQFEFNFRKRNSTEIKNTCYFRAPPNLVMWMLFSEVEDLILVASWPPYCVNKEQAILPIWTQNNSYHHAVHEPCFTTCMLKNASLPTGFNTQGVWMKGYGSEEAPWPLPSAERQPNLHVQT